MPGASTRDCSSLLRHQSVKLPWAMTKEALLVFVLLLALSCEGILRPQESETREIKPLDGIWNFRLEDYPNQGINKARSFLKLELIASGGFEENWWTLLPEPTVSMPVPSSYNDVYPVLNFHVIKRVFGCLIFG